MPYVRSPVALSLTALSLNQRPEVCRKGNIPLDCIPHFVVGLAVLFKLLPLGLASTAVAVSAGQALAVNVVIITGLRQSVNNVLQEYTGTITRSFE